MYAHIKARSQRHAPTLASVCRKPTNLPSLLSQEGQGMLLFPPPPGLHCQSWLRVDPSPRAKLPEDLAQSPCQRQDTTPQIPS